MPNMKRMQKDAELQIRSWGNNKRGEVVRDGVARVTAFMAMADYSPRERGLFLDGSVRIVVSAVSLDSIDFEQDTIRFLGNTYVINAPTTGNRPDGTVVLHDCNVIRVGTTV